MKKKFNMVLQGKGGVGKSYTASLLVQFLQEKNEPTISIDTDPNNSTLYSIKALKAKFLTLFDEDDKLNERNFDDLMELAFANTDHNFVVDNGATSFLPFVNYIKENDVFGMLNESFDVYVHVPITGGQSQEDTLNGLAQLIKDHGNKVKFVVWVNEYHGKIKDQDGNPFEKMEFFIKNKKFISAIFYLKEQNEKTFGKDLEDMTKAKLTFNEVNDLSSFNIMTKQRLKLYKKEVFEQLALMF